MKKLLIATTVLASLITPAFAQAETSTAANGYTAGTPVPIDYWAVRNAVSNVSLSPSGKYMALMKIESLDGDPVLEVWDTSDLSKPVFRGASGKMEFLSIDNWLSDDVLYGSAMQIVRRNVSRPEDDIRSYTGFFFDIKKEKFSQINGSFEVVSNLPKEPDYVLLAESYGPAGTTDDDPFAAFRPRAYYKVHKTTGAKSLVLKGSSKHPSASFDIDGNPRLTQGIDAVADEIITYYRDPGDTSWREIIRVTAEDFDKKEFSFVGDVPNTPKGIGYVLARNNEDTTALWTYDFNKGSFIEKVYGRPDADIMGVIRGNVRGGDDTVKGVVWLGDGVEKHFIDAEEEALYQTISSAIPGSTVNTISLSSRTEDGRTMIAFNQSDSDSGTYYLVKDGKMLKLGSQNPLLKPKDYSKVEFIKYPARDGLMIPAYVTHPKGEGPHPLIVLPHGGPYVPEVIVYDEWSQMLANNGYMVIQPQYRGSLGRGYNHYIKMWNEHGHGMQDDKDDGAKFLISRGDVDPDRVAMFGWSYGGYAALVATSREDQIYQCSIAGAFVADALKQYNNRKNDTLKYFDEVGAQRGGKSGINPINEVEKVNIPMLLIHPKQDRRVMYYHYQDYTKALKKAGKMDMAETLVLDKADHFLYTHRYTHNKEYYTKMLDYLKNDCGPGGL